MTESQHSGRLLLMSFCLNEYVFLKWYNVLCLAVGIVMGGSQVYVHEILYMEHELMIYNYNVMLNWRNYRVLVLTQPRCLDEYVYLKWYYALCLDVGIGTWGLQVCAHEILYMVYELIICNAKLNWRTYRGLVSTQPFYEK